MTLSTPELPCETIDYETLFNRLSSGLVLITANSRLARVLASQYGQWRINRGDCQWQSPVILSWDAWMGELWEAASLQGLEGTQLPVPGSHQLLNLWESVLKDDIHAQQLLRPESLANRLRDTRKLIKDWCVDLADPTWFGDHNENHAAFHHWNSSFEAICQRNGWTPPEDRPALLCRALGSEQLVLPDKIGLLGFDEFNPRQLELLTAVFKKGSSTTQLEITPAQSRACLWESRSGKDELETMARWVRHWFELEPASRIAIVVPDLQARRQQVERHLDAILTPGSDAETDKAKPWNTSLGLSLASVPMIESAFDLLRLLDSRIDIQDVGRVLRSPWIRGGVSERNSRALLEKCLRDNYPRQLKLSEVRYRAGEVRKHDRDRQELPPELQESRAWNCPEFRVQVNAVMQFEADSRGVREPSAWAEAFDQLLSALGWPLGSEAASQAHVSGQSENWQTFQTWQDSLRELASLDVTTTRLSRKSAISKLLQICREQIFQPRTPPAGIQVLGLYEVSGLRFDHLWVLGLQNNNWPPAAQPNPFIPGLLQQKAQLPQSSPQRELEVARTITQRLLETAADCVFSYPGQVDGEKVLPSPLLTNTRIAPISDVPAWQGDSWPAMIGRSGQPEHEPLLMPGPPRYSTARGGSSILKNQALCPFRAFASNRLGADGLATPADGISPMLHGSLMHKVLEYFWKETRTLDNLLALDAESLDARIQHHVSQVVSEERGLNYRPEFRGVEGKRLARLALAYLEQEKDREPFEVIGFEKEILQDVEGQSIRLVIDRVDRLESGLEAIIDYKTGKVDPKKWFGERPEDPQLPLYAISAENTPAAVAFAVIRDAECVYRGVVTQTGIFPGLPPTRRSSNEDLIEAGLDMPATIDTWRQVLHQLMAGFLAGDAAIDPKNGSKTCDSSYCDLQPLCRINELEVLP